MELIITSFATHIIDSCRGKEWTLNLRIVKIIKETITQSMVMMHTWMMTIDTATKLIALVVIIDDKKQGTHNIKEKPPPTTFTWHILQTTVFARLPFSHTIQQHAHDLMKIACCATFGVRIVGMTVRGGWSSTIMVWDTSKEAPSIAFLSYFLRKQWRREKYGTKFYVTIAVDCCAIKTKNDRHKEWSLRVISSSYRLRLYWAVCASLTLLQVGLIIEVGLSGLLTRFPCDSRGEIKAHNMSNIIGILKFCGHHLEQQLMRLFQSLTHPRNTGFSCFGLGVKVKTIHLDIVRQFKDRLQLVVRTLTVLQNLKKINDTAMFYILPQNHFRIVVPGFHSFHETFESR